MDQIENLDPLLVESNPISFFAHFIQHFHRTQLSFDTKSVSYRCVVELFEKTGENSSPLRLGVFEYWVEEAVEGWGEGVGFVPLADPPDHVAPVALAAQNKGLVTNWFLFCWLFIIKDRCEKVHLQQTHNQGLGQLLLTVSWDLRA